MSYAEPETSIDEGEPYFLYLLDNGVNPVRLTSDPDPLTRMGEIWKPSAVSHGDIEQSGNIEKAAVDLTFPLSDVYAKTLLTPASEVTTVTIWRGHHTDPSNELRVVWKGRVVNPKSGKQNIKVPVENISTSMRRPGCRARYQRTCRHALYFPGCNVNVDDFKVPATVSSIDGLVLTIAEAAAQPDGRYKAGLVIFDGLFGWVGEHVGDTITLVGEIDGLAEAVAADGPTAVYIAPGCDLSEEVCANVFGNHLNHGGFKNMSDNNPFSQSIT
ncbi:phage BR0599 family protein [Mesorhizobium salmacidum]|uniref:DUF2163 domain-containing protein n=1 Tax=Mesorhizobium salmacidum TaxID=3015171 RepID=A0ABU8L140_9HYPH